MEKTDPIAAAWDLIKETHPDVAGSLTRIAMGGGLTAEDLELLPAPLRPLSVTHGNIIVDVVMLMVNGLETGVDTSELVSTLLAEYPAASDMINSLMSALSGGDVKPFLKYVPIRQRLIANVALKQITARSRAQGVKDELSE